MSKETMPNGASQENGNEKTQDLVFDQESGSMITKEEYKQKVKEKLADPYGNPAK